MKCNFVLKKEKKRLFLLSVALFFCNFVCKNTVVNEYK